MVKKVEIINLIIAFIDYNRKFNGMYSDN
jgi:hypothetical protein